MLGISNAGGPGYAEHLALVWPELATELTGFSEQAARGGLSALLARFPHNLFKYLIARFLTGLLTQKWQRLERPGWRTSLSEVRRGGLGLYSVGRQRIL